MAGDDNIIRFPEFFRFDPAARKHMRSVVRWYALVGHTPIRVKTLRGHLAEMDRRAEAIERTGVDPWRVDETVVGKVRISTVFLGLDHRHGRGGPPLLFETMIFGGPHEGTCFRCATWDEAEAMHVDAVAKMRGLKVVK